ncbi:hypothetical protein G2W53_001743 [Senna tora]|uniref:Uncharacterized protein n=1 Tax=Senna tora TaxID=362788 RepID=A0A834XGC8_9FABA|nr:hypothetical protein G2W53_001743 [Senna tora]
MLPPPRQSPAAARPRGNPGLNAFKLGEPARNRDPSGVVEPVLLLRLSQQLSEQRMVEVYHRHQHPLELPLLLLPHIHRQFPLRHLPPLRAGLGPRRPITRPGLRDAHRLRSPRQLASPRREHPRHRHHGLGRVGIRRTQTTVSFPGSDPGRAQDPSGDSDQAPPELESPNLPHHINRPRSFQCGGSDGGAAAGDDGGGEEELTKEGKACTSNFLKIEGKKNRSGVCWVW